jgi:hypothetical protein
MAVRTETFRKVRGFRVDFGKHGSVSEPEDTDLCIRMAATGEGRWMYVPTATINHVVPRSRASLRFFAARCFAEGRGKAAMSNRLGSDSAIDTERNYAWTALRTAVGRLSSLNRVDTSQGLAMLLGLASAGSGYLLARIEWFVSDMSKVDSTRGRVHENG